MRRRKVQIDVSDHAVLRFLEREFGVNVDAVRDHIAGLARNGAELGALGVKTGRVKLICREPCQQTVHQDGEGEAVDKVVVVTALHRSDPIRRV